MNSIEQFVLVVLGIAAISFVAAYQNISTVREVFRTRQGAGIAKGIVLAVGISLLLVALFGCAPAKAEPRQYFDHAKLFIGLDYTAGTSPNCDPDQYDDKATSNLGIEGHIASLVFMPVDFFGRYTHHSCAYNPDSDGYDAVGSYANYRIYGSRFLSATDTHSYFSYVDLNVGFDYLFGGSDFCDSKWATQINLAWNLYRTADNKLHVNLQGTAHGCELSYSSTFYKGLGLKASYRF